MNVPMIAKGPGVVRFVENFIPNFAPTAGGPPPGYRPTEHLRAIHNADFKLCRREVVAADGTVEVQEGYYDLRRQVAGRPQADPFEADDLRDRVTPGGPSPADRAYVALLSQMRARYPSLFR